MTGSADLVCSSEEREREKKNSAQCFETSEERVCNSWKFFKTVSSRVRPLLPMIFLSSGGFRCENAAEGSVVVVEDGRTDGSAAEGNSLSILENCAPTGSAPRKDRSRNAQGTEFFEGCFFLLLFQVFRHEI